jgi:hypothetical protein
VESVSRCMVPVRPNRVNAASRSLRYSSTPIREIYSLLLGASVPSEQWRGIEIRHCFWNGHRAEHDSAASLKKNRKAEK